mgnify:FL=1
MNFFSRIFFETERGVIYIDDKYSITIKHGVFFVFAGEACVGQVEDIPAGLDLIRQLKEGKCK